MIIVRWLLLSCLSITVTALSYFIAPILSLFTSDRWPNWGEWFWTYDNPPEGDGGYIATRAPFVPSSTPLQKYVNRVFWLWRNPSYGFDKKLGIQYKPSMTVSLWGNPDVSDKRMVHGWYLAKCFDDGELVAFEFYAVIPYGKKCLNMRLGWKITARKFKELGFAAIVNTFSPTKQYGST